MSTTVLTHERVVAIAEAEVEEERLEDPDRRVLEEGLTALLARRVDWNHWIKYGQIPQ